MEALFAEVIGFSDFETKKNKKKIRNVKVITTGHFFHVLEGVVKSVVSDTHGIRTINMLVQGYKLPKLRKIKDFIDIDVTVGRRQRIVCIPVVQNNGGFVSWYYETYTEQEISNLFDYEKELFEANVKDFKLRDWKEEPQLIPVTFEAFLSRSGQKGLDYIASDDVTGSSVVSMKPVKSVQQAA